MPLKQPRYLQALVLAGICSLFCGCREEIAHDLSEGDLRRVVTSLTELGIPFERNRSADGKWTVSVDSSLESRAILALNERRVIRERRDPDTQTPSIFSGPLDEQLRFERSLSDEIERTIMSLDGVLEAKVHLNLPVKHLTLDGQKISATGSVLVVAGPDFMATEDEIAKLVSGAAGFEREKVAVLIKAGRVVEGLGKVSKESAVGGHNVTAVQVLGALGAFLGVTLMWGGIRWRGKKII